MGLTSLGGIVIGLIAGYYRRVDLVLMRVMDGLMAFPAILLAIALMAARGPGIGNVVFALSVVYTPRTAILIRSTVLSLRELDYVQAARALGRRDLVIAFRHICPTAWVRSWCSPASSSPTPSWPRPSWASRRRRAAVRAVVGQRHRQAERRHPRGVLGEPLPGLALTLSGLALNLLGDGLRDRARPRLRVQLGSASRSASRAGARRASEHLGQCEPQHVAGLGPRRARRAPQAVRAAARRGAGARRRGEHLRRFHGTRAAAQRHADQSDEGEGRADRRRGANDQVEDRRAAPRRASPDGRRRASSSMSSGAYRKRSRRRWWSSRRWASAAPRTRRSSASSSSSASVTCPRGMDENGAARAGPRAPRHPQDRRRQAGGPADRDVMKTPRARWMPRR